MRPYQQARLLVPAPYGIVPGTRCRNPRDFQDRPFRCVTEPEEGVAPSEPADALKRDRTDKGAAEGDMAVVQCGKRGGR